MQYRWHRKGRSVGGIPWPLSVSWMISRVFEEISREMEEARASRALSRSSLTTEEESVRVRVEPRMRIVGVGRGVMGMLGMGVRGGDGDGRGGLGNIFF